MTENIKRLYLSMDKQTRRQAMEYLSTEFGYDTKNPLTDAWVKEGLVPEHYQARVVAIFQNLLNRPKRLA